MKRIGKVTASPTGMAAAEQAWQRLPQRMFKSIEFSVPAPAIVTSLMTIMGKRMEITLLIIRESLHYKD